MEKNQTMTDEQLARELQNGKRGGGRGKLLTVIGCAATARVRSTFSHQRTVQEITH